MSVNYAENLSPYPDKGVCGLPEKFDTAEVVMEKVDLLVSWLKSSNHTVVHTGAGISTAAGIPDFRGPRGVWTLEGEGVRPETNITFDDAQPTLAHLSLVHLEEKGKLGWLVSQNIDGLHVRSGFPLDRLSELHGNMFVEECNTCGWRDVMGRCVKTMGRKRSGRRCERQRRGRTCRGWMIDTILDWEDELPEVALNKANFHASRADLSLCLGTSLRILPASDIPLLTRRNGGKLVIVNLQDTKHEKKCDLHIYARVDDVMCRVCELLDIDIKPFPGPQVRPTSSNSFPKHLDFDLVKAGEKEEMKERRNENMRKRRRKDEEGQESFVKEEKNDTAHAAGTNAKASVTNNMLSSTPSSPAASIPSSTTTVAIIPSSSTSSVTMLCTAGKDHVLPPSGKTTNSPSPTQSPPRITTINDSETASC